MKEEFVSYECAKRLKECGFDWKCDHYYPTNEGYWKGVLGRGKYDTHNHNTKQYCASAPTITMAQKWLREVKGWHIQIRINGVRSAYWYEIWSTTPNGPVYGTPDDDTFRRGQYETYELALSVGIDSALKILEGK